MTKAASKIVCIADLSGTFIFAIEGALAALIAGLDPVGVVALAALTALGGGMMRDLLISVRPPAAIGNWRYTGIVLGASTVTWVFHAIIRGIPPGLLIDLDAFGLALFAVAGTQKALDHEIHPLVAILLGTIGAVGGGVASDVVLNQVPRILKTEIYATAAMVAALIVVVGRIFGLPSRTTSIVAGLVCFSLRLVAVSLHWHLPTLPA
jgi:uncharacterized membrane protein YeiH